MRPVHIIEKKGLVIAAFLILLSLNSMLFIPTIAETASATNPFAGKVKLYEFEGKPFNASTGPHLLAYVFLKPQKYIDPTSELITLMAENDTLFKKTMSVAEYLNGLGFSVYFTNLAHSEGVKLYHSRLSVNGPISLFETTFNTTIRATRTGYINVTPIIFPDEIRDEIKSLEFATKPSFWLPLPEIPETGGDIPVTAGEIPEMAGNISTPSIETLLGKTVIFLVTITAIVILVILYVLKKQQARKD